MLKLILRILMAARLNFRKWSISSEFGGRRPPNGNAAGLLPDGSLKEPHFVVRPPFCSGWVGFRRRHAPKSFEAEFVSFGCNESDGNESNQRRFNDRLLVVVGEGCTLLAVRSNVVAHCLPSQLTGSGLFLCSIQSRCSLCKHGICL